MTMNDEQQFYEIDQIHDSSLCIIYKCKCWSFIHSLFVFNPPPPPPPKKKLVNNCHKRKLLWLILQQSNSNIFTFRFPTTFAITVYNH